MKVKSVQAAFVKGELSPSLYGRVDLQDSYDKAAGQLRNVYVMPQGGVFRREGLKYVDTTTTSQAGRLVGFEFNTEQAYLLVFTPGQFKVYKDDTLQATVSSSPISSLTADIIDEMNWTQSADTLILVHPDIQPIKITRSSHTSWSASSITFTNIPTYDFGSGLEAVISGTRGWPASITFFKGRLWLGGLRSRPQTILASKVGDFFNLDEGTTLDDEAINITIDDDRVNAIRNLFPGRSLQVFTTGGEFTITGSLGDAITPEKIATQLNKQTLHGSSRTRPLSVDGATIFIENGGYVVRQFLFNEFEQSYNAEDISVLSSHLIRNPNRMALRTATSVFPANYVYLVNDDGTMAVLSTSRNEKLSAWTLFETEGSFEDVEVVGKDTYCVVARTINGSSVRYIERLQDGYFLDASAQATGSQQTAWTGFSHLNGETVRVRGDDVTLDDVTVSSGGFTSSSASDMVEAGLFFQPKIQTLPVELVVAGSSIAGDWKRLVSMNLRVYNTRELYVSLRGEKYRPPFRSFGTDVLDEPVPLTSGWKKVYLGTVDRDIQPEVTQDDPMEWNVLSYTMEVGI